MMVISYLWGQKNYPIPYAWKKLLAYMVIAVMLFGLHYGLNHYLTSPLIYYGSATGLFIAYFIFVSQVEKKEFQKLPVIGKYLGTGVK
jgi:hypothetical protein